MTSTGCMSSTSGPDPLTLSWMATPVEIGRPPGTGSCGGQCDLYRATSGPRSIGRLQTLRLDRWWLRPLEAALYLGGISTYATWAALQTKYYATGSYISPLYSPCIASSCGTHATIAFIGGWWRWSPALLVVAVPVGVRATCYYYRKLYYRSFWLSPPVCAVVDPHQTYSGESRFPLVLQNAHRYFWMLSILVAIMLTADSVMAFPATGRDRPGTRYGAPHLQCCCLLGLCSLVPRIPPSCRGRTAQLFRQPDASPRMESRFRTQSASRVVCLGQSAACRDHRWLCQARGVGVDCRSTLGAHALVEFPRCRSRSPCHP
jgi:hypothetical protein